VNFREQLETLADIKHSFVEKLSETESKTLRTSKLEILQLNITRKCNLQCKHCHVSAGPDRQELMSKAKFESILELLDKADISTLDITGGAPEMNPHLEWFIRSASGKVERIIVRSNLVILKEEEFKKYIKIYSENKIEIVASLPHFTENLTDRMRGSGIFSTSIEVIKELNTEGYGKNGTGKVLNFVHNPVGAILPGDQNALETEFKKRLMDLYGIHFNNLFCITNMPLGRYLEYLKKSDNYEDYMDELICSFNPAAAESLMCKNTLNVSWDGKLYNCDFNQMLELEADFEKFSNITDFDPSYFEDKMISVGNHCFGCTAGSGSSCQGTIE